MRLSVSIASNFVKDDDACKSEASRKDRDEGEQESDCDGIEY